jgi:ribonuclease HI
MMAALRLQTDGASRGNPGPAAAAFVLFDSEREIASGSRYLGRRTNNEAEYEALIDGLRAALKQRPERLEILLDSELLVEQLRGRYRIRSARLLPLWQQARDLLARFPQVDIRHVRRSGNDRADALANAALDARRRRSP